MTKCEVLLCTEEATNFQNEEGKGSHAFCDRHIITKGGLNMATNEPPRESGKKSNVQRIFRGEAAPDKGAKQ